MATARTTKAKEASKPAAAAEEATKFAETKAASVPKETIAKAAAVKAASAKAPKRKVLPKLDDSVRVQVRSNQYGTLGFINRRTGDKTTWYGVDDVQVMTVGDIRNMRTSAPVFLSEPWIWIESIDADECDELTEAELYEVLGISKYYNVSNRPKYLSEVYQWDAAKIQADVPGMTFNTKQTIAIALNEAIRNGSLDNLSLIKTWEKNLGFELDRE